MTHLARNGDDFETTFTTVDDTTTRPGFPPGKFMLEGAFYIRRRLLVCAATAGAEFEPARLPNQSAVPPTLTDGRVGELRLLADPKAKAYNKTKARKLNGAVANTCYQNSIVQCLSSVLHWSSAGEQGSGDEGDEGDAGTGEGGEGEGDET